MKVTVIPIVIRELGTVSKGGLEDLEIRGRMNTIQTTPLLRSARILRRILETWGDLLSLKLHTKLSANAVWKTGKGVNNNNVSSTKFGSTFHAKIFELKANSLLAGNIDSCYHKNPTVATESIF